MRNKLILLAIGLILPIALFALYLSVTGSPVLNRPSGPPPAKNPFPDANSTQNTNVYVEQRTPAGDLIKTFTARSVIHRPGAQADVADIDGIIVVEYSTDQKFRTAMTADHAVVIMEPTASATLKSTPKEGTLSGNVIITRGPEASFRTGSSDPQPGQLQIRLDKDVNFDIDPSGRTIREFTSKGKVHVVDDRLAFDGEDMTLQLNKDQQRIDFLQIAKGDKLIVYKVGKDGFDSMTGKERAAPLAGEPPVAATEVRSPVAAEAATGPAKSEATVYGIEFGQNVLAKLGTRSMASDELHLTLMFAGQDFSDASADKSPTSPDAGSPTPATPPAIAPPSPTTPAPAARPATADDLVLTWSGPLTVRPLPEGKLSPLLNPKDRIVDAFGSVNHPVLIKDGDTITAEAGEVQYSSARQQAYLLPGENKIVKVTDSTKGSLITSRIDFKQETNEIDIAPGSAIVDASALHHDAPANAEPLHASWQKSLHVDLAKIPDPKDPTKNTLGIKHAKITGNVTIVDPQFSISTNDLDVAMASIIGKAADGHATSSFAVEHAIATDNVVVKAFRTTPDGEKLSPDQLTGQRLELFTAVHGDSAAPQPDKVKVDGKVMAFTWQPGQTDPATGKKIYARQQIEAPHLLVDLLQKERGATTRSSDIAGGMGVKNLLATGGTKVTLEGVAKDVIVALADSINADAVAGTAVLLCTPKGVTPFSYVHLMMGAQNDPNRDEIQGMRINVSQKAENGESIVVPGEGNFTFIQPPTKDGDKPLKVNVAWLDSMSFNRKTNLATFQGNTHTVLLDRPDQNSELKADTLLVQIAASEKDQGQNNLDFSSAAGGKLQRITAKGNVTAKGETLDGNKNILTRMLLHNVDQLIYTEADRMLKVPAQGEMLVEDYRPEPPDAKNKNQSTRGTTSFKWAGGMIYDGKSGLITLDKNVWMRHQPTHPIVLEKGKPPAAGTAPQNIDLQCQNLVATVVTTKDPSGSANTSSPVALGANGQMKVTKVVATTGAQINIDKNMLSADTLTYDTLHNIALAESKGENWAQLLKVPDAIVEYRKIQWDFTTGELITINPRAKIIPPTNSGLSPIPTQP